MAGVGGPEGVTARADGSTGEGTRTMRRHKSFWAAVALLGAVAAARVPLAGQGADVEQIRAQLVGSYRLVWYRSYDQAGKETVLPYTVGQISYDRAGRMSAQLMRESRPRFGSNVPTEQERAAAYSGFISYFGHYTIDPVKRTVTHHVEGSMSPNMVGNPLTRYFEFSPDGSSLFLSVKDGDRVVGRLQWDRYR